MEEFVFRSNPVTLSGTPPANGWVFTWDAGLRNGSIANLKNPNSHGITLRAVMYPFKGKDGAPCFDTSPQFSETPTTVLCTEHDFRYNHNASDPDLDSLVFRWGHPLDDIQNNNFDPPNDPDTIPFASGYSKNAPTPGPSLDPNNVPASIDPNTGEIAFTSYTQGSFVTVVKVESWRNGQKVAEIFREMQIVLVQCGNNAPPVVTPPFDNGTAFSDTVYAGEEVVFNFNSSDNEELQDGSQQSNILKPAGMQFGKNFNDPSSGCPFPPCATLSDPMPLEGQNGISTTFEWQTTCAHVKGADSTVSSNTYTFTMRVRDDFCPAPGVNMPTVSITVLDTPAIEAPSFRCVSVLGNGDAELNWVPPPDPNNGFNGYVVHMADDPNGPFAPLDTIDDPNVTSYVHAGANADNGAKYYYLETISGCSGKKASQPSDTLASMFLELNAPGNGTAELSWDQLGHTGKPDSAEARYMIHRKQAAGNWAVIDSVPYGTGAYVDTISVCSDSMTYKVTLGDASGCSSVSSLSGDVFKDRIPPSPPEVQRVTVDTAAGLARIEWEPSPQGDTEGYLIVHVVNGGDMVIDTVWGRNNTEYLDPNSTPGKTSETYGIAAFDSCWSGSPPQPNTSARGEAQTSVYLRSDLDICASNVTLSWNPYINWDSGVKKYEIYAAKGNGVPKKIGKTTDTSIIHSDAEPLAEYCYVVKAIANDGRTVLSNERCQTIQFPDPPQFLYMAVATVRGENSIAVRFRPDPGGNVDHYRLDRGVAPSGAFEPIKTFPPNNGPVYEHVDTEVNTQRNFYDYRVVAVDSCGNNAMGSNIGRTMRLKAEANDASGMNRLRWNPYENWDGGVKEYRIYRGIDGNFKGTPLDTVPAGKHVYKDDVSRMMEEKGRFCYYVEAVEKDSNAYGAPETSRSNKACAYQEPKFWVPNAFMVGGKNEVFKPVIGYVDVSQYSMSIYDRWGERIFYTEDPEKGWDGTYQDELVREGAYVYLFEYKTPQGKVIERRGSVMMLRNR